MKAISAALILVTFTFANQKHVNTKMVTKNIEQGLTHKNPGVVESSIRVAILVKIAYPDADYGDVIDELEDLIMDGANKNIRLKALIAADYLNNFDQYQWLKQYNNSDGEQVFDAYLNKLNFNRIAKTN